MREYTFWQWYSMQPVAKIREIRNQIIEKCELKRTEDGRCPVFETWRSGRTSIPPLAQKVINEIAGQELSYSYSAEVQFVA